MIEPRVRWTPGRSAARAHRLGRDAVELSALAGLVLDDWQEMILVDSLRRTRAGLWRSSEVGVDLSRQNGKGGLLESRQLAGLFLLREALQVYSAHLFDTSLEAWRRLKGLIEDTPELHAQVRRYIHSHGDEGIELHRLPGERFGPRIRFRTRTKSGGRGFTGDTLYLDEAMVISEAMHGALLPTLSARPNPQIWYTGSPVDQLVHEHGVVFARVRERGHRGGDPTLSWWEWSAPVERPDEVTAEMASDPELWRMANPAIGVRITERFIETELRSMDPRNFAVERLGVGDWPRTDRTALMVIDLEDWQALAEPGLVMGGEVALAFDVSPDRYASVTLAGRSLDGSWLVDVVDSRRGTKWVADRVAELVDELEPVAVVCDGYGPSAVLESALADRNVVVEMLSSTDHSRACARFVDYIADQDLRHLEQAELTGAVRIAKARPLGEAWAWSRKNSTGNISPLVSATLALSAAVEHVGDAGGYDPFTEDELAAAIADEEAALEAVA